MNPADLDRLQTLVINRANIDREIAEVRSRILAPTQATQGFRRYTVSSDTARGRRRQAICNAIGDGSVNFADIAKATGLAPNTVRNDLARLRRQGLVVRSAHPSKPSAFVYALAVQAAGAPSSQSNRSRD